MNDLIDYALLDERDWLAEALDALRAEMDALEAENEKLRKEMERLKSMTAVTMGIGSGDGNLFVHGDYESIKAAQAIVLERDKLRAEVSELRAAQIAYANEFPATEDGDPDTGNIHANIRTLKARAEWLADALRKLEEHRQSDEALLRQALEALERGAWDTLSGRNAAFAIRESLGLEQEDE